MFTKTMWLAGAGAGYVLGARAGRERYDQINNLRGNPKVQEAVAGAQDVAAQQAASVKEKATSTNATSSDSGAPSSSGRSTSRSTGPSGPGHG